MEKHAALKEMALASPHVPGVVDVSTTTVVAPVLQMTTAAQEPNAFEAMNGMLTLMMMMKATPM